MCVKVVGSPFIVWGGWLWIPVLAILFVPTLKAQAGTEKEVESSYCYEIIPETLDFGRVFDGDSPAVVQFRESCFPLAGRSFSARIRFPRTWECYSPAKRRR